MSIPKILSSLARNNVLPLSVLRRTNYPLFSYYKSNSVRLSKELDEQGIMILDDQRGLKSYDKCIMYLLYNHGEKVNLTKLRKENRNIYNYISTFGGISDSLLKEGFIIEYDKFASLDELIEMVKENGNYIDKKLYDRLYYHARMKGQSVWELLREYGIVYSDFKDEIIKLRDIEQKSFREISKILKLSLTTVYRRYMEVKQND